MNTQIKQEVATMAQHDAPDLPIVAANTAQQSLSAMLLDSESLSRVMAAAELLASSKITVPKHLQGNVGDCAAVVLQAQQWGMNPFAVAQKTHISKSGQLAYEAQLINAVLSASGAVVDTPEYEFLGDWSKILGKVERKTGQSGGEYFAPGWKPDDEKGLGVICRASTPAGNVKEITIMLSQCYPRFSTQWATDPMQQITYVAVRKLSRRYFPGAILGVYFADELEELDGAPMRDINPPPAKSMKPAEIASRKQQQEQGPSEKLLKSARDAADRGKDGFATFWKGIKPADRGALRTEVDDLARRCDAADARTVEAAEQSQSAGAAQQTATASTSEFDAELDKAAGAQGDYVPE